MTPQEKANQLVEEIMKIQGMQYWQSQMCALICCEEVLGYMGSDRGTEFWTSVKQEIENL